MSGPDIRRPEAIDARWLTQALQAGGVDAVVRGFDAKAVGTGQIGDSIRFTLDYARAADDAPASVVGKFPSADPVSFGTGVALGNYVREVRFYQHLAATAGISTPRWYVAEADDTTSEFVLLMEDLAPAEQGDQLAGVTLQQARTVIDEAAKLHASHWQDPHLDELPWVSGSKAAPASAASVGAVQELWKAFRARYADRLTARHVEVGERLAGKFGRYAEGREGPRCLTHNDFRPDNMMFATPAGGRPVSVLDWQSISYGVGAVDVAYFLAGALPREMRLAHEAELLDRYHEGLIRGGVGGYSGVDLVRDYAGGGFLLFLTAFFAAMIVKQTDRGDDMFMQMIASSTDHILDHDALRLLD